MCTLLGDPLAAVLKDHDASNTGPYGKCTRVEDLIDVAKLGYWGWKTWKWLETLPV